jgi:AraC-like DNA-binding protein
LAKLLSNSLPPNNEKSLIFLNMRFSLIYSMINDKKNSDLCINEALKISLTTNDKVNIKESYRILANNCFLFKDYYKAIFYGLKAENYNKNNTENLAGKMYIDSLLYLSYEYIGDNENALKYYKNFVDLKNKYYENGKVNELNKLDIMFKVEENKKKLALNELEQTKDKATIQFLFWIILVTLLLILMALGYYFLERKRIKLIYSTLENSDKEIKSVKGWLEWRNQNVTNPTSNLDEKETVIENDFNSPAFEIDEKTSLNFEINNVNSKILYYELRELLDTKKLYLNPELTLDDLIKLLGTNKKYLYYAIKLNYEDNFRSLLNEYRINHVKLMMVELVKNNKKIRIEDIQESSGFQSTASFFRVFKSKTGLTPLEYYEQVKQTNFEDEIIKVAV